MSIKFLSSGDQERKLRRSNWIIWTLPGVTQLTFLYPTTDQVYFSLKSNTFVEISLTDNPSRLSSETFLFLMVTRRCLVKFNVETILTISSSMSMSDLINILPTGIYLKLANFIRLTFTGENSIITTPLYF